MTIYDLSHRIETGITTYPGDPDVSVSAHATHAEDGFRVSSVAMGSHTGTHIDAPSHTEEDERNLDGFDIGTFVFDARVVRLDKDPRTPITRADLAAAVPDASENLATGDGADAPADGTDSSADSTDSTGATDETPGTDCLLLYTGWDAHWNTDTYLDHPYLTADAARWCASRDYHVGIDALNVDPTPSENATSDEPSGFGAHHALLGDGRLIIENLRGLDVVPDEFTLYAFPLALADADGAPVRAVAVT